MFQYNRFWHFWFQLNNRHYFKAALVSLVASMLLIPAALFFPPFWGLVLTLPVVVGGAIALFTQLSNFFYNRQNQLLTQLKTETADKTLQEEIDLYLNRRVVCPQELLVGSHLNLPPDTKKRATANTPFIFESEETLSLDKVSYDSNAPRRNPAMKATNESNELYVKTVASRDGLSEIAAREMAEILGFGGLIPSNTIAETDILQGHENGDSISNTDLALSRQKIKESIDARMEESPEKKLTNTPGVQNAVAKFLFNLKTAAYRAQAQEEQFKLLHIQKLIPEASDGIKVYTQLFNEPVVQPGQLVSGGLNESEKQQQRDQAKKIIQKISLPSFQENFLLHLILGSQDANPGNTLFTEAPNDTVVLHSIDHERIMPEDNYNITKKIPFGSSEQDVKNVFPIRLWLAGLPQADVPFTKEIMEKTLSSLNPKRLLAYHQHKKLFSPAAVGAQLERIGLIKEVFEKEIKKSQITLTPKQLFLKVINNHPTYLFLKDEAQLSDFRTFTLLGYVPEGADMSLLRHPLQWFPMVGMVIVAVQNEQQGRPAFSEHDYKNPHVQHLIFFSNAQQAKQSDTVNKAGLDILTETSNQLRLQ